VVDPDVDRLVIINEDGTMFNEEYTLVAVSDYVLGQTPGNTVSQKLLTGITIGLSLRYTGGEVKTVSYRARWKL